MYSLVLMAALTTAPDTPQFDGRLRDAFSGCTGCYGRDTSRESDTARSGSCSGSCHCHGGVFHGGIRNFFHNVFGGCRGSCYGSCRGSCTGLPRDRDRDLADSRRGGGCAGGYAYNSMPASCFGSGAVSYGSCLGSVPSYEMGLPPMAIPTAPFGDYARPQEAQFGMSGSADCNCGGAMATGPVYGSPYGYGGPMPAEVETIAPTSLPMGTPRIMPGPFDNPAQPRAVPGVEVEREGRKPTVRQKLPINPPADANRGTVVVRLPADAKLFVEGKPLTVTNGERTFVTPPLPSDRDALYSFKAEFTRDGETVTVAKKVKVRAGDTASVEFTDPAVAAKSDRVTTPGREIDPSKVIAPVEHPHNAKTTTKTATPDVVPTVQPPAPADQAKITVKLPPGATLYVNGTKNEKAGAVREFATPKLTPGKTYQYTMRAETTRNGLPEYQEQKVDFRCGDSLTVDFTTPPGEKELERAGR